MDQKEPLEEKCQNLFEQYGKMHIGNKAPDIDLGNGKRLSLLDNDYKLIIFGASWCPYCQEEYPKLKDAYRQLKENYNLEAIYISIDSDRNSFNNFFKDPPFMVLFDGKGWDTVASKDYYIASTPTILLLDKKDIILAKIKNMEHLVAWLEYQKKQAYKITN